MRGISDASLFSVESRAATRFRVLGSVVWATHKPSMTMHTYELRKHMANTGVGSLF